MTLEKDPAASSGNRPSVSIIMPVYGVEEYLSNAIECILRQTFDDWELIIVDDCSPDRSGKIAQDFAAADERIEVIGHSENRGLSAARNTGLSRAKGRYVWFPDPDDDYDSDLLECAFATIGQTDLDVVVFGHIEVYCAQDGSFMYDHRIAPPSVACPDPRSVHAHVLPMEQATILGYAWNKLYRLDLVREGRLSFKDNLPLIEDLVFNVEFFDLAQSAALLDACPYHYAKRQAGNLTNKFEPRYYELHRMRIKLVLDQQKRWGLCTPETLSAIGSLYGRYVLSALERNCDPRSRLNGKQRREWCRALFKDNLFQELIPVAHASESRLLSVGLSALRTRSTIACTALGRALHLFRTHGGRFFTKAKSKR